MVIGVSGKGGHGTGSPKSRSFGSWIDSFIYCMVITFLRFTHTRNHISVGDTERCLRQAYLISKALYKTPRSDPKYDIQVPVPCMMFSS